MAFSSPGMASPRGMIMLRRARRRGSEDMFVDWRMMALLVDEKRWDDVEGVIV